MARLNLTLLGAFEARLGAGASPLSLPRKTQALLCYLALANRPVTRTELATLLWGDTGREQAQQSLRQTLSGLRQALDKAADTLVTDARTVSLEPSTLEVDTAAFEALLKKGDSASLAQATSRYRGELLAGLDLDETAFEEWLLAQRERLRELAMNGLTKLLAEQTDARALEDAVLTATRLLGLDPLHEPAHRALMRLYITQGRRPAALRQYQTCVSALRRELGVEPTAETQQVYAETLREAASSAPTTTPSGTQARAQDRERLMVTAAATPFVGRESELEQVMTAVDGAFGGRGAIVAVFGEAGVGKTRLLRQVAADAAERGARVLVARAYRSEQILPLGPWRNALRDAGVVDDPESVLQAGDPARLFKDMDRLVEGLAAERPLVLLLEDLQWADDMSLRLLGYLGRRLTDKAVVVVISMREEELEDAPGVRSALADLDRECGEIRRIPMPPLSQEATVTLVRALARPSSEPHARQLSQQIWTASEGNPFIAIEILRSVEEGASSPAPSALPLPERVRQVVNGRLDRLTELARGVLGVAAVIGRDSDFALLRQAAQLDDAQAATAVEELVRRRIFRAAGERFEFTHERIREIVYGGLLLPRRRLLHRQAAQAIQALYSPIEPHYAVLGAHAFEAEQWPEAADFFRRAGEWAMARSFNREAAAAFERAVEALDRVPGAEVKALAVDVRLQLRNALMMIGELARGRAPLEAAQRLAETLGDPLRLGRVGAHVSSDRWWQGRPAEALEAADAVARIAEQTDDPALRRAAIEGRGYAYHGMGNFRAMHQALEPLFAAPEGAPYGKDLLPVVSPLHQAIAGLAHCGEFELALSRARDAVGRAEALDHRYLLLHACWTTGEVHAHRASAREGIPYLERALGLILERSDFFIAMGVLGCLGYLQVLGGQAEEGLSRMREGLGDPARWRIGLSRLIARLGEACLIAGRPAEAQSMATRCLDLTRRHGERGYEAWALRLLGEIELASSSPGDQAQAHLMSALAMSDELGMKPMAAHCHAGLARFHRDRGDMDRATHHRNAAATLYRDMAIPWWAGHLDKKSLLSIS
jgi:DNA-binding SARP family transcriptional activator/type II secretory pathway predicted ATPase ExeA